MKKTTALFCGLALLFFSLYCEASLPQKLFLQNTGSDVLRNAPVTFGVVFEQGAVSENQELMAEFSSGERHHFQMDRKATFPDGSLRHGIISMFVPELPPGKYEELRIVPAEQAHSVPPVGFSELTAGNTDFRARLVLEGQVYVATLADALNNRAKQWLEGPVASEWVLHAPFRRQGNNEPHPHLAARFHVRKYAGSANLKIDFILENCTTWTPGLRNYVYDVEISSNGNSLYTQNSLLHFVRARWKKTFWLEGEPAIHVMHDPVTMIRARAIPAYDPKLVGVTTGPIEDVLVGYARYAEPDLVTYPFRDGSGEVTINRYGPMGIARLHRDMRSVGGREEIGPFPTWTTHYLTTQDRRAKAAMMMVSDLAGSWPVHYRDEKTGQPLSIADHPSLSIHSNTPHNNRPTATVEPSSVPYAADTAHQPSLNFIPYIVSGDYYHLEEMKFWMTYSLLLLPSGRINPDGSRASWRGQDNGIFMLFDQVRARAWMLRNMAQLAAFTPDDSSKKSYYNQILTNNIQLLPEVMERNAYGFVTLQMRSGGEQPWMDDFLTWATGYAVGLGFDGLRPFFAWKARFPVQRMGFGYPGNIYCWQLAAPYKLEVTPGGSVFFDNINQIYTATFPEQSKHECGSAPFLQATGYDSAEQIGSAPMVTYGYSAILSIALAAAVDAGTKDAEKAWEKYYNRGIQPDLRGYQSWAIVPFSIFYGEPVSGTRPKIHNIRVAK
ncbi:hypothetical protein [Desulfonatronum thioautotrophicum]|uniref:RIFT barrel domain-containing protein n=1 Tax=Desulfonatronum thioautotrophicum TaxID=617001 RepID=UPI0005EAD434|nr:hypothetical protein [Desulfonatronum thioautotrophicum]